MHDLPSRLMTIALGFFVYFAVSAAAESKKDRKRTHHQAHEHGIAALAIAIEGLKASLELKIPAEDVYGFEHKPKSKSDQDKVKAQDQKIKGHISAALKFPDSWQCRLEVKDINAFKKSNGHEHSDGQHSEVFIHLESDCKQPLKNGEIKIDFSSIFPTLNSVQLTVVSAALQKQLTLKGPKGSLAL